VNKTKIKTKNIKKWIQTYKKKTTIKEMKVIVNTLKAYFFRKNRNKAKIKIFVQPFINIKKVKITFFKIQKFKKIKAKNKGKKIKHN